VAGSSEDLKEPTGPIYGEEFLGTLSDYRLLEVKDTRN
jgi:hypothetical protein